MFYAVSTIRYGKPHHAKISGVREEELKRGPASPYSIDRKVILEQVAKQLASQTD